MARVPAALIRGFDDRDDVAREALNRWLHASDDLEFVSAGASFTYRFESPDGTRYLRITPPGWRSEPEVRGEMAFVRHLAANGIAVATNVPSLAGERIETVESSAGRCMVTVAGRVDGDAPVRWAPAQAYEAGRLMAHMHVAAHDFVLPPGTSRLSWLQEFAGLDEWLQPSDRELRAIADETLALFESLPRTPDCYGVIHYDLSGDNLVWRGGEPVVIDFDDCMTHWYVADLARTVGYFRADEGGAKSERETAMLTGYNEIRPLEPEWQRLLPAFVRFALLLELAWMSYASRTRPTAFDFKGDDEARLREVLLGASVDRLA